MNSHDPIPPPPGAKLPVRLLKPSEGIAKPDVWIVDLNGTPVIWKSWGRRPGWERATLGKWLAQREGRIIAALQDLPGFPAFVGHPHPWTVAMSLLDAEPVPEVKAGGALTLLYFDRLWAALSEMHRRGINHGDLRRKNLLRAPGDPDTPRLVDFTQSLHFSMPVRGLKKWIHGEAIAVDRSTFLKLKRWFLGPAQLTAQELEDWVNVPWHLKAGRWFRQNLYRPGRRRKQAARHAEKMRERAAEKQDA